MTDHTRKKRSRAPNQLRPLSCSSCNSSTTMIGTSFGLNAGDSGEGDTVTEAFKPYEEPDDAYSIVGFFTGDQMDAPRGLSGGRSVY